MDSVILFDPGIRSLNKGDEIIMRSAEFELERMGILSGNYVIHSATHAPIVTFFQNTNKNPRMKFYNEAKYKIICGSNLLWKDMLKPRTALNINLWNCLPYKNSILMGVGTGLSNGKTNAYTRKLYSKVLSKDYIHSTRDERTAEFLRGLGYHAIDTGCPTMWRFTKEFCKDIPSSKADNVIFTLTDYGRQKEYDQQLIDTLRKEYKTVYFWIQGAFDFEYFNSFNNTEGIIILAPDVDAYSRVLEESNLDYVGTRLHAGMFAMQHKKRTIILAIDNRVRDLKNAYHLNAIERKDISELPKLLNSSLDTDIRLKMENIQKWASQFE